MGLWKAVEEQKVTMVKIHPRSERTEHARSMTLMAVSCSAVSSAMAAELLDEMPTLGMPKESVESGCPAALGWRTKEGQRVPTSSSIAAVRDGPDL